MKKIHFILFITLFSLVIFSGCARESDLVDDKKLNVMVSILPQVDFVERIGGDRVFVESMIPPGYSPEVYDPSPGQIRKLSDADLYIKIGHIPFEKANMDNLRNINKKMIIVDSSLGIDLREIADHDHEDEKHEDEEQNEEGSLQDDPHIWLDPALVKIQAENIYKALIEISPEDKDYFYQNKEIFLDNLEELDQELEKAFEPAKGKNILVFHPAFGYLADAYGFKQKAIEIEGKDPTIENIQMIIKQAKLENTKVIFVQKQFSTKSAQVIADGIGGSVVQIDPLAKDYFANMRDMAYNIINETK